MDRVALDTVLKVAQRFSISPEDVEEMFNEVDLSAKQVIEAYRYLRGGTR